MGKRSGLDPRTITEIEEAIEVRKASEILVVEAEIVEEEAVQE